MYPIRRETMLNAIGFDSNIPADFSAEFTNIHVSDTKGITHVFNVRILPSQPDRKHRIFVSCNMCRHWIPFGRIAQHNKRRDH